MQHSILKGSGSTSAEAWNCKYKVQGHHLLRLGSGFIVVTKFLTPGDPEVKQHQILRVCWVSVGFVCLVFLLTSAASHPAKMAATINLAE